MILNAFFLAFFLCFVRTSTLTASNSSKNPSLSFSEWKEKIIQERNKEDVRSLLNQKDSQGNPIIFFAIQQKDMHTTALFLVLANGINVNALDIRNQDGFNIVHVACTQNNPCMLYFIKSVLGYFRQLNQN